MRTVSWAEASARRHARHHLSEPGTSVPEVTAAVCGIHAQILSAAEVSIGMRVPGVTRADVQAALWTERSIVKTYGPRGTVHLLPTRDLPMWTGALSAIPATSPFPEGVRLTPAQTDEVVDAVGNALRGKELTLEELDAAVVAATGGWAGDLVMPAFQTMWPRWRQAIHVAGRRGVLSFGPNRGRRVTYTNPGVVPMPRDRAVAALVDRYLRAYGPATPAQFAQWVGAPVRWATEAFQDAEPVDFDGTRAWIAAGDTEFPATDPAGVVLLPYFDAFVVGSQPRARLYPGRAATRALVPSGQAGNYPVMLVDGVVAGVWHQRRAGRRIEVTVEPLGRLSARHKRELEAQTVHLGRILGGEPSLTIGTVTVGAHA